MKILSKLVKNETGALGWGLLWLLGDSHTYIGSVVPDA